MFKTLEDLLQAMRAQDPRCLDRHGQWRSDLPTFGGEAPSSTLGVWSWDESRLIVGSHPGDLEIISRSEWEAEE